MATITSTTNGNFSSGATWVGGVAPVDADSFVIANSHIVTYDVTSPVTNGFDDSDIYGTLRHQANANTTLRMNGRLRVRTNGCYYMCDGSTLQFRGTAAESHILYVLNEANASFIADGSDGMPSTTLSQEYGQSNTFIQVANAASFRPGEWIAVMNTSFSLPTLGTSSDSPVECSRDEGLWIHDVQANTLFIRQFVGPENSTVTSYTGNTINVANSKVWRVGQEIIFGTGADRNIKNIIGIDYAANTLTVNGPNLANDSVYRAGAWFNQFGANATFTTGIDAPDGSTDAVRWTQANTGTALLRVNIPAVTTNGTDTYALSFWARFISGIKTNLLCDFNDTNPQGDYSATLVANEWRRVVFTGIPTAGSRTFIDIVNNSTTNNVVDFWGLQLEVANTITNNTASEYIPTNGTVRSIRGTVTGNTIYETCTDKIHAKGDKVRKIATLTTVASNSSQTTITVANVSSFLTNDEIWIEARSEAANNTDRLFNAYPRATPFVHTISSISGNTITLSSAVGYNVVTGALVTRMTRKIVVEPVTPNSSYYGMYTEGYTTNWTRRLIMKDILFRYVGSSQGAAESGIYLNNGYFSTSNVSNTGVTMVNQVPVWGSGPWIEGVTATGSNSTRDLGGFFNYIRMGQTRASTVVGIFNSGIALWYADGTSALNNIASGSNLWGFRCEYYGFTGEFAYNYSSRNERGFRLAPYDGNMGTHHFIVDAQNGEMNFASPGPSQLYKIKITGGTYGLNSERGHPMLYYSQYKLCSGFGSPYANPPSTYQRGWYHTQNDRSPAGTAHTIVEIIEDDFEIDKHRQMAYLTERYWDQNENAWRVVHAVDTEDSGAGWFTWLYVPARTTLRASCQIKLAPSFGTNYPVFEARASQSTISVNKVNNLDISGDTNFRSWYSGGAVSNTYTALSSTQYEERQLTLGPVNFPRHIIVGVRMNNRNQFRGFWMRDINVFLDTPYLLPTYKYAHHDGGGGNFGIQTNFDSRRIRIGGSRIKG